MALFQRKERDAVLVNMTSHGIAVARLTRIDGATPELTSFEEIGAEDEAGLGRWVDREFPNRSGYIACYAGFSPPDRILEREIINGKRVMDRAYVNALLNQRQPTASTADWQLAFLDVYTGVPLDPDPASRPGLFFGVPLRDITATQKRLVDAGLRPQRLELGILPLLGGVLRWQATTAYPHRIAICEIGLTQSRLYILAKDGIYTPPPLPHGLVSVAEAAMKDQPEKDIAAAQAALKNPSEDFVKHAKKHIRMVSRHLRPAIDSFEMQTGLRVGALFCSHLPSSYRWLETALASSVDMDTVAPDPATWENILGVKVNSTAPLTETWFQTLCLVGKLEAVPAGGAS